MKIRQTVVDLWQAHIQTDRQRGRSRERI